jgi:hypothetical protein
LSRFQQWFSNNGVTRRRCIHWFSALSFCSSGWHCWLARSFGAVAGYKGSTADNLGRLHDRSRAAHDQIVGFFPPRRASSLGK